MVCYILYRKVRKKYNSMLVAEQPKIGKLIRELRQAMGLTQEKFAAKVGVTFPTINRWENGQARPSPLAMEKIEGLLRGRDNSCSPVIQDRSNALLSKYFPEPEEEHET